MVYRTKQNCKKQIKNKAFIKAFPERAHKEDQYGGVSQQVIEDEKVLLEAETTSAKTMASTSIIKPSAPAVDEWDDIIWFICSLGITWEGFLF